MPDPLSWSRHYRSSNEITPEFGVWRHGYWASIKAEAVGTTQYVTVQFADGSGRRFSLKETDINWQTQKSADTFTQINQQLHYKRQDDNSLWIFDLAGKLQSIKQQNGWTKTFAYNANGQLISVTNQFGRSLSIGYDVSGRISQVTLPTIAGVVARSISYTYDQLNRLVSVTYPDNTTKSYLYENLNYQQALSGIIDENGVRFATYKYNNSGQATLSELAEGVERYVVSYTGSLQYPAYVQDPLGTLRRYGYGASFNQLAVTESDMPSATGRSDAASRIQSPLGLIDTETDFLGLTTQFTWDTTRRLPTQVVKAAGRPEAQTVQTQWHPSYRLPMLITETGRVTAYTYDGLGNRLSETITDTSVTPNVVRTSSWQYNTQSLVVLATAPNGATTSYTYDSAGNMLTSRNALGHVTSMAYAGADGAAGRVTSMTAPNGLLTSYTYDARGRLLSSVQAAGTSTLSTLYAYTPSGQLASARLPSGHVVTYSYDAAQRLTGWADNRGATGVYTLDGMGNRTTEQIKNSAGQVVWQLARSINALNRVATETIGAAAGTVNNNQQMSYGYNANGSLTSEANAQQQTTSYGLDGLRRVTQITNAANASASLSYNALDAVTSASDFKGVATATPRDALGNALSTSSLDAGSQSAEYDALGLPRRITDALGQATLITRDALGRPTQITQQDGRSTTLRYDLAGTTYNATGFANASKGYLSEIQDTTDKTSYQRDGFGRVIKKTQQLAPFATGTAKSISYSYASAATGQGNGAGQMDSITYPNGTKVSYLYSAAGQISQINWGTTPLITNIQYTPLGQPASWAWEFADTSATTVLTATRAYDSAGRVIATELGSFGYDSAGRITSLTQQLAKPSNTLVTSTAVTTASASYTISYDSLGRITSFARAAGLGAASTAPWPAHTATFSYDANGNRLASLHTSGSGATASSTNRSYSVGASSNQLLGWSQTQQVGGNAGVSSSVNFGYDANGSLINDGLRRYEFDAAGRLAAMTTGALDSSPTTRYVHNALGQRLFKTEPQYPPAAGDENDPTFMASLLAFFSQLWGGNTGAANPSAAEKLGYQYYYDEDGSLLYELGSGGANSTGAAHYVYLPTPAGPMPVAFYNGSRHYAVHTDHLNTPRRLTQSDKKIAWQWAYSAFGEEQPTTGRNRYVDPSTTPNAGSTTIADVTFNLRYPGQYFDKESNLHYNYFRSYDSRTGRYTQADPIDLQGGWNKYNYVSANPLAATDLFGLDETVWRFPNGPTNGNWGGRCWSGGQQSCGDAGAGTKPPTDSADACYQRHDICYAKCGNNTSCLAACNKTMVEELRILPNDPRKWPQPPRPGTERDSRNYRDRAIGWYSVK